MSSPTCSRAVPRPRGGGKLASPILLLLAVGIPIYTIYLAPDQSRYIIGVGTLILTYVMLGWGLNIVVGLAGLLDPATAAAPTADTAPAPAASSTTPPDDDAGSAPANGSGGLSAPPAP